jgi:hypothetical protein
MKHNKIIRKLCIVNLKFNEDRNIKIYGYFNDKSLVNVYVKVIDVDIVICFT